MFVYTPQAGATTPLGLNLRVLGIQGPNGSVESMPSNLQVWFSDSQGNARGSFSPAPFHEVIAFLNGNNTIRIPMGQIVRYLIVVQITQNEMVYDEQVGVTLSAIPSG